MAVVQAVAWAEWAELDISAQTDKQQISNVCNQYWTLVRPIWSKEEKNVLFECQLQIDLTF